MAQVTLRSLVKNYDETPAVRGIDLDIADEEFVVLVGPSGCGKSTTLRMIAGLEEISDGEILIGGEVVNDVPPKDRNIAMVFQNYALYPHMTVYENMSFGLLLKKFPKDEIARRVDKAARILDIGELLERKPKQLSGGQRQRICTRNLASRFESGSSNRNTLGSRTMARPIATRCRWPPERCAGFFSSWSLSPRILAASSTRRRISSGGVFRTFSANAMFR